MAAIVRDMTAIEVAELAIREAADDDAAAVAGIFAHYVNTSVATFETEPRTVEQWRDSWSALRAAGWPFLVATIGGEVVGFAYVAPWRVKPAYRHTVETTVYFAPGHTGLGYGELLSRALLEAAAANGAREVIAVIADTGSPASVALHRKLGFAHAGTLRAVGHKFGRWINVNLMQKTLG
jgi:L-amino acid N-acyltransferase YncA